MSKVSKPRLFLLLLATFTTLMATASPQRAQACFSKEIYLCTESDGSTCLQSEFPCSYNNCTTPPVSCTYYKTACC
jgi:hypothetical protein